MTTKPKPLSAIERLQSKQYVEYTGSPKEAEQLILIVEAINELADKQAKMQELLFKLQASKEGLKQSSRCFSGFNSMEELTAYISRLNHETTNLPR